jgi:hypothetical protein
VRVDGVGGGPPQALDQAGVRPDQELDGLETAVLGGQVEGGLAPAVPDAGVAGVLQQEADDGGVSVLCGAVQRRFVVFGLERNETRKLQLSLLYVTCTFLLHLVTKYMQFYIHRNIGNSIYNISLF